MNNKIRVMRKLNINRIWAVCLGALMLFSMSVISVRFASAAELEVVPMGAINRGLPAVPNKGAAPEASDFVLVYGDQKATLFMDAHHKNNPQIDLLNTTVAPYTHSALISNRTKSDIYRSTYSDSQNALIETSDGAGIALKTLASDIELVGGVKPTVTNNLASINGMVVIAGTIGESQTIDTLVSSGKIDVSEITGKWESYVIKSVNNPLPAYPNITRALVIAGSDMRGTVYGIYKVSEAIGVSPWVWWADSYPVRSAKLTFKGDTDIVQGEPSVKYRGIFLNDENPGLSPWVNEFFKQFKELDKWGSSSGSAGYNHHFYTKVFELLLRLKGNYMWPAMWNNAFHMDDPLNGILANQMGIVMGASHHEHMDRADKEWNWTGRGNTWAYNESTGVVTKTNGVQTSGVNKGNGQWDWSQNSSNIKNYWRASIIERLDRETIVTMGMRGQEDTALIPNGTTEVNVATLGQIINAQVDIIEDAYEHEYGDRNLAKAVPKTLILYKEVEEYYYGFNKTDAEVTAGNYRSLGGLRITPIGNGQNVVSVEVPDHVTLMLCDDNFGNVRTLPTDEMRDERYDSSNKFNPEKGGFGMYYHFDYHGGPISHEWLGQTPLEKVNDNMTKAYEAGVDRMWIVNVGDLKPKEMLIDYFINLGYDYDAYKDINKMDNYVSGFLAREFASASEDTIQKGTEALNTFNQLTGARKAETLALSTLSLFNFDEAERTLRLWDIAEKKAESTYNAIPDYQKDTWYQYVLYPVRSAANVYRMNVYGYYNEVYAKENLPIANVYADLAENTFKRDSVVDVTHYNSGVSNGKWFNLITQKHINYTEWDTARVRIANPVRVENISVGTDLAIRVAGSSTIVKSGSAEDSLTFNSLANEQKYIDIYNAKSGALKYTASASDSWIVLGETQGTSNGKARLTVGIDPTKVSTDSSGTVTIKADNKSITVDVSVKKFDQSLAENAYLETDGYVSIAPQRYVNNVATGGGEYRWMSINNYGRDYGMSALRINEHGMYWEGIAEVPYVEYKFYIQEAGTYKVNTFLTPAVNSKNNVRVSLLDQLRFTTSIGTWTDTKTTLVTGFRPGEYSPVDWQYGVLNNTRMAQSSEVTLASGMHTLKVSALDAGVVIQKIIIAKSDVARIEAHQGAQSYHFQGSYFGAPESYYKGAESQSAVALGDTFLSHAAAVNGMTANNGMDTWLIVLLIVVGVLVLAGGGFAIYFFVIRKKQAAKKQTR